MAYPAFKLPIMGGGAAAATGADYENSISYFALIDDLSNTPPKYLKGDRVIEQIRFINGAKVIEYLNMRTEETYTKAEFDLIRSDFSTGVLQSARKIFLGEFKVEVDETAQPIDVLMTTAGYILPATANLIDINPIIMPNATNTAMDYIVYSTGYTPEVTSTLVVGNRTEIPFSLDTKEEIDAVKIVAVPAITGRKVALMLSFYQIPN